jgi:hypothetical protein
MEKSAVSVSPENNLALKDCHPEPFKRSSVSGAQGYLVLSSIAILFAVAMAYFIAQL